VTIMLTRHKNKFDGDEIVKFDNFGNNYDDLRTSLLLLVVFMFITEKQGKKIYNKVNIMALV
jgi:hypothetical protein